MQKLLSLALIITSLFCYLEWGGNQSAFLFQMEYILFFQSDDTLHSFTHPAVLLPMCGQLLLLFTLLQQKPNRHLALAGMILLAMLVLLVFAIGLMGGNAKIALSAVPFLVSAVFFIRFYRKAGTQATL